MQRETAMPEIESSPNSGESTALFVKLASALTGISEAKLVSAIAIDPAQVIDSWYERFCSEPLQLADFIA
jgi:hypothetical protein